MAILLWSCEGTQSNPEPMVDTQTTTVNLPAASGSEIVTFKTNHDWKVTVTPAGAPAWLDVTPPEGSAGENTLSIKAPANEGYEDRSATVKIESGTALKYIGVLQKQKNAILLGKNKFEVPQQASTVDIEVRSNVDYAVEIREQDRSWINDISSRALSGSTIRLNISANPENSGREGHVTIREKNGTLWETVKIFQNQKDALILTSKEVTVGFGGEEFSVELRSNIEYDVEWTDSWIRKAGTRSMRTDRITFAAERHQDDDSRTAIITFKATESGLEDILTVIQTPEGDLIVSQNEYNVPAEGRNIVVNVSSNMELDIEIRAADIGWISNVTSPGTSQYSHTFRIEKNDNDDQRVGNITFKDRNRDLSEVVTVNQNGQSTLILTPDVINVDASRNIVSVELKRDIEYEIEFSDNWVRCNTTPVINETVELVVDTNTTYDPRSTEVIFKDRNGTLSQTLTINQEQKNALEISKTTYMVPATENIVTVTVSSNIPHTFEIPSGCTSWISPSNSGNTRGLTNETYRFLIKANTGSSERSGDIIFESAEYGIRQPVTIIQSGIPPSNYYADGEVVKLQSSTVGDGINIVILGDGFTQEHLARGGKYEISMETAMEYFFSVYPYTEYRDYFNVYMVAAISAQAGVSYDPATGNRKINNRFDTMYGSGTYISGNDALIRTYAGYAVGGDNTGNTMVIAVLNSPKYAGTCWMYYDGFSIGYCPMSTQSLPGRDFRALLIHECGGHGFGHLIDEYITYDTTITRSDKDDIISIQNIYDWYRNVDFTNILSQIYWKDFIGNPKYRMVGAYQGGGLYAYGIWRPESNSCMNNNVDYFNAPSRWAIVKRIMELAGQSYTIDQFIFEDRIIPASYAPAPTMAEKFEPLHPPIVMEWSR